MSSINQQQQILAQQKAQESVLLSSKRGDANSTCDPVPAPANLEPKAPYFYYRDHSETPDRDPSEPITIPGRIPNFPAKLFAILSRPELSDIISWMPHGRSWKVHKPREFEVKVIPAYFDHSKYSSFIRQANGWGFQRISTKGLDRHSHYHELFLRGIPHLIKLMKRPSAATRGAATTMDRPRHGKGKSDPDFYIISQEHPLPEGKRSLLAVDHSLSAPHSSSMDVRRTLAPIAPAPTRLAPLPSTGRETSAQATYVPQETRMLQHTGAKHTTQVQHPEPPVLKPAAGASAPSRKLRPKPVQARQPTAVASSFEHQAQYKPYSQPSQNYLLMSEEIDPLNVLLQDIYEEDQQRQNVGLRNTTLLAPSTVPMASSITNNYNQHSVSHSLSLPPQPMPQLHMPRIVCETPVTSTVTTAAVSAAKPVAPAPPATAVLVNSHAYQAAGLTTAGPGMGPSELLEDPLLHLPSSPHGHASAVPEYSTSYGAPGTTVPGVDTPLLDELFAGETLEAPGLW